MRTLKDKEYAKKMKGKPGCSRWYNSCMSDNIKDAKVYPKIGSAKNGARQAYESFRYHGTIRGVGRSVEYSESEYAKIKGIKPKFRLLPLVLVAGGEPIPIGGES